MVLTVTEDTPADMLAGSMELLVQLPRDHHIHTQRVTVERSTAMMDLLVQIATAHKLAASSYTLQAIGEHGLVLPHQSNTPIGALDALEVKLLPKQGTFIPRKTKLASQPFETTFRLQVHLPRNQLYVSRVSPKTNLGDILEDVCREKNLDKNKYELRHPGNHKETLDLSLSLQDYHLQEVTLYAKQGQSLGSALSSQDIMALQRQEERRRQQAKQSVFGFIFKKSKESSLSTDSLGGRSVSPARSDETGRSISPLAPPTRPQRKRRPAPNPPTVIHQTTISPQTNSNGVKDDDSKEKLVISHSRNSSDSSGYHEASVLSDNPESAGRMPETLPRRSRPPSKFESRKLAQTSQTSKSLCNLATSSGGGLTHAISNTSLSSTGIRKKRAAPKPPISRPLSSAISTQALERIVDSEESLTSDMGISKPPSDIAVSSGTEMNSKANSDIAMSVHASTKLVAKNFCHNSQLEMNDDGKRHSVAKLNDETCHIDVSKAENNISTPIEDAKKVERARVAPQGKLVRSGSSFDDNGPTYSFISQNRYEIINEVNETSNLSLNCVRKNVISSDKSMGNLEVPKKFVCKANINSPTLENLRHQNEFTVPRRSVHGITTFESLKHHNDVMIEEKLVKIPTIINLNNIDMNNTSTGKSENAIDCNSKARNKNLKKIPIDRYDKSAFLMNSHSFCCSNNHLQNFKDINNIRTSLRRVSKSGNLTMTNSYNYNDSVTSLSSNGKKICSLSDHDLTTNNSSSPPSNTLQIFAISTEPVNIHAPQMNLIPNEVNDIPSFPLLNKFQSNAHVNKKLNILEPPPPGLVSREESNENWNQFLIQLNTIIESRVAPVPKPRNISKGPPITPRRMFNHELSSSTNDVESNISVKNISRTININDFDEKNLEQQDDEDIDKYTNSNNERIILENANEFIILDNNKVDNNDVINKLNESCAVISTVPKCSRLASEISGSSSIVNEKNIKDDKLTKSIDEKLLLEVSKNSPRFKVFRSLSAFNNFDVNSFEKNNKKVNSHDRNFTCALNPNFSTSISHMDVNEKMNLVMKTPRNALSENDTCEEQYPPFITHSTNLGLQMDLTHSTVEEKLYSQRMGKAGVDDSPTETDLLLQKVSTTLANVSPISERLSQDVPSNEVNHVEKMDRVNSKADKAPAHDETGLDSTPNMTLNSQQDTSDYVSATGEDLSATDWEYQLPDPPSAFRDNVAPDHDDYETITLRSVDAFKEPIVTIINSTEKDFNRQVNVQNEPEHIMQPDTKTTLPTIITTTSTTTMTHLINEKCDEKNINIKEINRDINTPRSSLENHKKDSNNELKKEVISELENKIENGIFNPPNRKYSDEEFNQSCIDKLAPKIAPIENTLPNFTITTYPRQKSLNIYDSSVSMSSSHLTDSAQNRIVKTFATLSRNTSALSRKKESYTDLLNHNHRQANNFEINNGPIIRATSIQHINLSSEGLKNPVEETIEVPLRHQDTANSNDKTNIVHRSKSYIVLSHNSKYRSNKTTLVSNIIDDKSMMKSTSVTNLNQDTSAIDKEKSHNQEKDLKKFHNEKNENRELQSVQVLKSILPQLKDAQHTDKSASEISVTEHYNEKKILDTKSDETDEVQMRNKTEAQTERNKSESEETIKRWRYTGPPAISLGSWSERPCLNVKIKMDTDYKFSVNNNNINHYSNSNNINNNNNSNNNNTTGAKTIVNLNSSSNDVDIVNYKDSFIKNLPKNHMKNDNIKLSSNDKKESDVKRVMDDVGITKKKITNTSLNQMQSGLKNFDFVKLRMRSRDESDKPVVVTNVAVKKSYADKPELKDDDIKIDTRPVNFKALTQAFGQVNLRAIPKHNSQNRHSDYFDARQNGNDLVDNKFMNRQTNIIAGEINRQPIKRYTSVIGIDAQPPINNYKKINEDIKKIHSTTTKVNGPVPIVKGFHINHTNKTPQNSNSATIQKNSFTLNNKINGHVPPPPPTMPVITGVTLKSNNAAPKSMSTCKDPRDQLLESIRNYGRDKLKNVNTVS